jgi:transcriptional regulator of NAD metabolism
VFFLSGDKRRSEILNIIKSSDEPVSANQLARQLGVSRQVIVSDIALLRASCYDIISTHKGYMIPVDFSKKIFRVFTVSHTNKQIQDELNAIVDLGGKISDVTVNHLIYGTITANLSISSRKDVEDFMRELNSNQTRPLKELTNGVHSHTVFAKSEEILNCVEIKLREKGYLIN